MRNVAVAAVPPQVKVVEVLAIALDELDGSIAPKARAIEPFGNLQLLLDSTVADTPIAAVSAAWGMTATTAQARPHTQNNLGDIAQNHQLGGTRKRSLGGLTFN